MYSSLGNSSFSWYLSSMNSGSIEKFLKFFMVLQFHKKISDKFEGYFFKELEFMELEYPKSGRFLHISKTVVD